MRGTGVGKAANPKHASTTTRLITLVLTLALSIAIGLGVSSLANAGTSDKPQAFEEPIETSLFYLGFEAEGIPQPVVDGWYSYKGDGRFTTESGLEFFWRDGEFVNPDGTLLQVPESLNAMLKAKGLPPIEHQPTRSVATKQGQPGSLAPADLDTGDYLQYARVLGLHYNCNGVQADASIFDRSEGYDEYYLVGVGDSSGRVIVMQMANYETNDNWVPNIHIVPVPGDPSQDVYRNAWDRQFSTSGGAVWKNMKLARRTDGTWTGYVDAAPVFYQLPFSFSVSSLRPFTQVELCTDSNTDTPHNPANHHYDVKARFVGSSVFVKEYGDVELGKWIKRWSPLNVVVNNLYDTWNWQQHYFWDWMLEDNN